MKKIKCDFTNEKNGNVKLSNKQILELKKEWSTGDWTLRALAARYGISHGHVYKIVHEKIRIGV